MAVTLPLGWVWEFYLDGDWQDVTEWVRMFPVAQADTGRSQRADEPQPGDISFQLNNGDDRWNPLNPTGPWFGHLRRNTPMRVTLDSDILFYGEIATFPPKRDVSKRIRWVPMTAAGVLRRQKQGRKLELSAYRRYRQTIGNLAYWPMEDAVDTSGPQPDVGARALGRGLKSATSTYGKGELTAWLPNVMALHPFDTLYASVQQPPALADGFGWEVSWIMNTEDPAHMLSMTIDCYTSKWGLIVNGPNNSRVYSKPNNLGSVEGTSTPGTFNFSGGSAFLHQFRVWRNGGNTEIRYRCVNLETSLVSTITESIAFTLTGIKEILPISLSSDNETQAIAMGHLAIQEIQGSTDLTTPSFYARGLMGEGAVDRLLRVCLERGIAAVATSPNAGSMTMGRQFVDNVVKLLADVETTDTGILREALDGPGFEYVPGYALVNQTPAATLDYAASQISPPLDPTTDDRYARNTFEVSQRFGPTFTVSKQDGPLGTAEPEDGGLGVVDDKREVGTLWASYTQSLAEWFLAHGTLNKARWPSVTVNLLAPEISDTLRADLIAVRVGNRLLLTGLDSEGHYDDVDLIVLGISRTFNDYTHMLTFSCIPGDLYRGWRVRDGADFGRLDSTDTWLDSGTAVDPVSLSVMGTGARWTTDAGDLPFDVMVSGMRLTVTAVAGASFPQTLTVTPAVNGVHKALPADAPVMLADDEYIGVI